MEHTRTTKEHIVELLCMTGEVNVQLRKVTVLCVLCTVCIWMNYSKVPVHILLNILHYFETSLAVLFLI